jgi:RNA polymerase sigma-70 factor (ECF subfamily)
MAHSDDLLEYDDLIRQHHGRMLAVARQVLRDDEDAHDAVQDALLAAFRSLSGFRAEARLSTWLHRIVVNAALLRLRGARRRREQPMEDVLLRVDRATQDGLGDDACPEQPDVLLERAQLRRAVRDSIAALPSPQRRVLLLRDIEERSTEEVADLLGVSPNAVKIRLHRARRALRRLLRSPACVRRTAYV